MDMQDQQQQDQSLNLPRADSGTLASGPPSVPTTPALSSQAEFKNKIIEILAGTANGCLAELGYYPTLHADMQKLRAQNQFLTNCLNERDTLISQWQQENRRLWEDNRRLISLNTDIKAKTAEIDTLRAEIMGKDMTIKELTRQVRGVSTREADAYQILLHEHQALLGKQRATHNEKLVLENTIAQMKSMGFGLNNQQGVAGPSATTRRNSAPIAQPSQPMPISQRSPQSPSQAMPKQPTHPLVAQILPFPRQQQLQNPGVVAGWTANQHPQRAPQIIRIPSSRTVQSPNPPLHISTHSLPPSAQMPPTPPMSAFPAQLSPSVRTPVQVNQYPRMSSNNQPSPVQSNCPPPPQSQVPVQQSQAPTQQLQGAQSSVQVPTPPEQPPPQTQIQNGVVPPTPPVSHKSMSPEACPETKPVIDAAGNVASVSGTEAESNSPTLKRSASSELPESSKRAKVEQAEDSLLNTSVEMHPSDNDEVVEVDATGLRPISVVVAEDMVVADEADPNIKHCFFCRARYEQGALSEPPKPFVNNPEEMEKHMIDAHPIALDSLRKQIFDE
ncbi:uncharacterized protein EV420DRAFT_1504360 [Desarmillaria tabescens]|uniref:Uncharacterized protein n=1 Tax=Armillaria tabescens TaxID=1929756 RepID=A0AA39NML0_ARMTA|nr:uncharacterized protein EV420DRAFT_1504360 [Desarmillaria tabescens]KAK0468423.1 hypothetical protein EV420DRAFT_1504360 [Desarmillaria tabescens]